MFLTLTYREEDLPVDGSVDIRHWQEFTNRARSRFGKFRYFHCGEYGDMTGRPHYHAAIFGQDWSHDRKRLKRTDRGDWLYVSESLDATWALGDCYIGELTFESAAYVARYCTKKVTGEKADEHYRRFNPKMGCWTSVRPEYASMSRRPGIGAGWYDRFSSDVYPHDYVVARGHKAKPPAFYDRRLEAEAPDTFAEVKRRRRERGDELEGRDQVAVPEVIPEDWEFQYKVSPKEMRRRNNEKNAKARLALRSGSL